MSGEENADLEKSFYMIESLRKRYPDFTHIELKGMLKAIRTGESVTTSVYAPCMKCSAVRNTFYFVTGMILCKQCYHKSQE